MMPKSNLLPLAFRHAWIRLAKLGKCDAVDGVEFNCVLREWEADGRPGDDDGWDREGNLIQLDRFIVEHANQSPTPPEASVSDLTKLNPFSYSQREGEVVIEVEHERPPGSAEVVVDRDNVMTLLQVVMTALRVGNYPTETLNAAAMVCKANLGARLR